jgi:hypothetical protein
MNKLNQTLSEVIDVEPIDYQTTKIVEVKSPVEDDNQPVINAFYKQRNAITNFIKACCGIPLDDLLSLHKKI